MVNVEIDSWIKLHFDFREKKNIILIRKREKGVASPKTQRKMK